MTAYYNEHDPKAAAWLRELIKQGHIADGVVDERSIEDVLPSDLDGFTQCHFFAGIGGWSHALRLAGWPDDKPVWTGSCPCQPFSAAGKGLGTADERHLWPAFHWLINQCRPAIVFGEQVASRDGREWLATVRSDMEVMGYAVGAADLCAAGTGAPHIRQRLYFVADTNGKRRNGEPVHLQQGKPRQKSTEATGSGEAGFMGHAIDAGLEGYGRPVNISHPKGRQNQERHGAASGFWSDAEYIPCTDGYSRPVEPGTFPLVTRLPKGMGFDSNPGAPFHDSEARVMRLRGYGNAIVPQVGAAFVRAYAESV